MLQGMTTTTAPPEASALPRRRRASRRRRLIVWASSAAALVVVLLLGVIAWVQWSPRSSVFQEADVPERPVALVLGAGLRPDGTPSTYLARRLDIALDLYQRGLVRGVLASGDNSTTTHDEPSAMRDYLVARGMPADVVALDYAGFDTHDSCVRAHQVFGVTRATVITQDYHLPRALFSCKEAGIDAVGVGASSADGHVVRYTLREMPASLKAAWDAVTHRTPKFLGPHEPALDAVLTDDI